MHNFSLFFPPLVKRLVAFVAVWVALCITLSFCPSLFLFLSCSHPGRCCSCCRSIVLVRVCLCVTRDAWRVAAYLLPKYLVRYLVERMTSSQSVQFLSLFLVLVLVYFSFSSAIREKKGVGWLAVSKSRRCTLVAVKCSLTSDAKRSFSLIINQSHSRKRNSN